jgi:hypothetical protein
VLDSPGIVGESGPVSTTSTPLEDHMLKKIRQIKNGVLDALALLAMFRFWNKK